MEVIIKKITKSMPNVITALTARTQFGQVMRRATEKRERFVVRRRGSPSVVIMSLADYIDTFAPTPAWLKAIGAEAKQKALNELTMEQIDAEIAAVRRERRQKRAVSHPGK